MDLFVIDLDDPRERWEELYARVRQALSDPHAGASGPAAAEWEASLDPLALLHVAYWSGA